MINSIYPESKTKGCRCRVALVVLLAAINCPAEETDPEMLELQKIGVRAEVEKKLADAETAKATAMKAQRETSFGPTITPRAGTSTSENSNIAANVISQHQLSAISGSLADDLRAKGYKGALILPGFPDVALVDSTRGLAVIKNDVNQLSGSASGVKNGIFSRWKALNEKWVAELDDIKIPDPVLSEEDKAAQELYERLLRELEQIPQPEIGPPVLAPGFLSNKLFSKSLDFGAGANLLADLSGVGTAAQIGLSVAALFRVDRVFEGVAITPSDEAFTITLAEKLLEQGMMIDIGWLELADPAADLSSEGNKSVLYYLIDLEKNRVTAVAVSEEIKALLALVANKKAAFVKDGSESESRILDLKKEIKGGDASRVADLLIVKRIRAEELRIKILQQEIKKIDKISLRDIKPFEGEVANFVARATEYRTSLEKGSIGGMSVSNMLRAERVAKAQVSGMNIIFTHVNFSGGLNLNRTTTFTNSFSAAGGSSVACYILSPSGKLVYSKTHYDFNGFHKIEDEVIGDIPSTLPKPKKAAVAGDSRHSGRMGHPAHLR